jgi:predicted ABC-type ATPase
MKTVIILRGCSGSGKTTFTDFLLENKNNVVEICADNYFIKNGEYNFDPSKLGEAHQQCKIEFKNSLEDSSVDCIVIANTNTKDWEFEYYESMAKDNGCRVFHIVIENRHNGKNIHKVPEKVLDKQRENLYNSIIL